MVLLLDAANTIIHKPSLYTKVQAILRKNAITITLSDLAFYHKIVSEIVLFPDRTNKEFYHYFNKEWMYSIGIIASDVLLDDMYSECSYLPWEIFEDVKALQDLNITKSLLSNFHNGLNLIMDEFCPGMFSKLIISEEEKIRKPDLAFYSRAIEYLNIPPSEIIYVGDSIKLDLEPALRSGMNAWLIDRNNYFPHCKRKISKLSEIANIIHYA